MSDTLRDLLRFTDEQKQELRRRMMTDTLRDRIAMTLLEHRFVITGCTDQPMCCACQEGCSDAQGHMLAMDPLLHDDHIADAILALPGIAVVELDHTIKWLDDQAKHCTETAEDCEEEPEAHCKEMFYRGQAVGFGIASKRLAADAERDQ